MGDAGGLGANSKALHFFAVLILFEYFWTRWLGIIYLMNVENKYVRRPVFDTYIRFTWSHICKLMFNMAVTKTSLLLNQNVVNQNPI